MFVRRRALQVWSVLDVSLFVSCGLFISSRGAPLLLFLLPHRQIPLSLTESRCPVSLRFFALTSLLRPVRSDAARIHIRLAFCSPPPRGSHKALAILLSNLDREGV